MTLKMQPNFWRVINSSFVWNGKLMMNLQVAVPPSTRALMWFCCQPESSEVFPIFFLSKEKDATIKSLYLNDTRGVFGIGTAIYFASLSSTSSKQSTLKRFLSSFSFSLLA